MMQIVIDIPSAFIDLYHNDRFYDALMRLSSDAHLLAGRYEQETAAMLIKAFEKAVEVPAHGRLIDADALFEVGPDIWEDRGLYAVSGFSAKNIYNQRTIIPADKEDGE